MVVNLSGIAGLCISSLAGGAVLLLSPRAGARDRRDGQWRPALDRLSGRCACRSRRSASLGLAVCHGALPCGEPAQSGSMRCAASSDAYAVCSAVICGLIIIEPDYGTAVLVRCGRSGLMLYPRGSCALQYLIPGGVTSLALSVFSVAVYHRSRCVCNGVLPPFSMSRATAVTAPISSGRAFWPSARAACTRRGAGCGAPADVVST